MSNDLISRRSIIEKLENALLNGDLTIGEQGLLSDIVSFVAIETTAYDIDKVVEELEEKKQNALEVEESIKEYNVWNDAIEIVKQGGVSDDVCEWKLEDEEANLYLTGCQQRQLIFEGTPKENGYRYCPYCGKKIKAVE